ncbi:MAG: class I SAM-dependent methyltransferase [Verrucomicrobiota bacterium]
MRHQIEHEDDCLEMNPAVKPLEWTGERMVPEICDRDTVFDHVFRYKFAIPFAKGKDVLDIACGEGYGSACLARLGARSVVGVDIDEESVAHARRKYGIEARVGSAESIPAGDDVFDLIVSFETIEHVSDPGRFLDECARVCRPGGTLVVSTPNKDVYLHDADPNDFHLSEMDVGEFLGLLEKRFSSVDLYGQCMTDARWCSMSNCSVATGSPWFKVPGVRRLRSWAQRILDPALFGGGSDAVGLDPMVLVGRQRIHAADRFNPHLVRPVNVEVEKPCYLIAVARL